MAGLAFCDIETDGLNPTKVHCVAVSHPSTNFRYVFETGDAYGRANFIEWVVETKPYGWVFHNGLGFDVPVINDLIKPNLVDPKKVIDTFVVSRLINYTKFITHSLEELGKYLGEYKGDYTGGWEVCSQDMIDYCAQDVVVTEAIYKHYQKYINDTSWRKALRVEHDMAIICKQMTNNGFYFAKEEAETWLKEINLESNKLKEAFQEAYPPRLMEVNRIQNRVKKDGSLFSNVEAAYSKYPLCRVEGSELVCFDYVATNPDSPKDRIDVLWDSGWKPVDMTDGHKKFIKESRK